jgi:hypothetical protein
MTNTIKLSDEQKSSITERIHKHPFFAPAFTKIDFFQDNYGDERTLITRDFFAVMEKKAKEIMKENGITANLSDDDTAFDFWDTYSDNIALIAKDFPKMSLSDLQDLLTYNKMVQHSACVPSGANFIVKQIG